MERFSDEVLLAAIDDDPVVVAADVFAVLTTLTSLYSPHELAVNTTAQKQTPSDFTFPLKL